MSPLQKGQVTAAAQCSQRKTLSRITHPHAAPCIHHGLFVGFSAPSASQRCVVAAKSYHGSIMLPVAITDQDGYDGSARMLSTSIRVHPFHS